MIHAVRIQPFLRPAPLSRRSHIVNLDRVAALPFDEHRLAVRLTSGETLVASRTGSARLRRRMSGS
ncbi:MAG TPA: hypothetical protein VF121_15185 [Thermoanaerobaculia bacterium]|nr:hypothetical protein [Thermoanaerobaculia bacterium]